MTSIILNGACGKMGQKLFEIVKNDSSNFKIVLGVDINCNTDRIGNIEIIKDFPNQTTADAIIDFSHPNCLNNLLQFATTKRIPIVIATTGYNNSEIENIKKAAEKIPIFFSFNMSLGINLLINLVKKSYNILKNNFDIEIIEKHHNQKIDAPSGTALMIANAINEEANNEFVYVYGRERFRKKRNTNEIGIHSIRSGTIIGEHEVIFSGNDEIISLTHTATSKKIFAIGALKAAEFIKNKLPNLYTMKDLVDLNF